MAQGMIRTRFKKVLLIAPEGFPDQLLTDCKELKRIDSIHCVFPSLYEFNPHMVIFDYDFVGEDIERVLRRITINKFYNKLKICCYKNTPNEKTDGLLKALGVDELVYLEDIAKSQKPRTVLSNFSAVFDTSILKWMGTVSN